MARETKWTDGWHEYSENFKYLVEDGVFKRGVLGRGNDQKPVYPYRHCPTGGYDIDQTLKANKRNFERISWQ